MALSGRVSGEAVGPLSINYETNSRVDLELSRAPQQIQESELHIKRVTCITDWPASRLPPITEQIIDP